MTHRLINKWLFLPALLWASVQIGYAQPAWTLTPAAYQFSMNVIAQLRVGGQANHTTGNTIAAFHQGDVRGVATPLMIDDQAYYFLTVFGNGYGGDSLVFKAYLLVQNQLFESSDTVVFYHQQVLGSLPSPFPLNFAPSEKPFIYSPAAAGFLENACPDTLLDVQAGDNQHSEGNGLTYSLTGGADRSKFSIDPQTGILSWFNFSPDFENPADANAGNTYEVQVTVIDQSGYTDLQAITVTVSDNLPPAASCPPNRTAGTGDDGPGNCSTTVAGTGLAGSANACAGTYGYVLTGATSGNGAGNVPAGQSFNSGLTTVTYTVTDGEPGGSSAQCSFTVTVTDDNAPSVVCPGNQTAAPTNPSPCTAVVGGIDAGFSDNCGSASLSYTLGGATTGAGNGQASGLIFAQGLTTVTYTATDGANLTSACTFTVSVSACNTNTVFSGTIKWEHDGTSGVQNAIVNLTGGAAGNDTTGLNGDYLISIPPTTGNFTLKPTKNTNKLNGLTSADATAIQQHVANTAPLSAPFKRIAADVNKSNSITLLDATLVTQALQGNTAALNQITSWRFVPAAYTFPNPNVPWGFPEQINLTGVNGNVGGQDFNGIKLGDVVSTWANPANFGNGEPLVFRVLDQVLEAGSEVVALFQADQLDDLNSFQFALHFDPEQLELAAIEPLSGLPVSMENFGTYNLADGELRVVWAQAAGVLLSEDAPLFRLRFNALKSGARLSAVLQLDDSGATGLPALCYNSAFSESGVELRYVESTGTGQHDPALWLDNRPNPFLNLTTIHFVLPRAGAAELRVTDASGRRLFSQKKHYAAGQHVETLRLEGAAGVLIAELLSAEGRVVRKMLAVR